MKKAYIRPESRLFAINFTENIADASGGTIDGGNIAYGTIPGQPGLYYTKCHFAPVYGSEPSSVEYYSYLEAAIQDGKDSIYKYFACGQN